MSISANMGANEFNPLLMIKIIREFVKNLSRYFVYRFMRLDEPKHGDAKGFE